MSDGQEVVPGGDIIRLVIISHGMWGRLSDMDRMRARLQDQGGSSTFVYAATSNVFLKSYSGVDTCGTRLAAEIRGLFLPSGLLENNKNISSLSLIGYSAGGLFVRYAIGLLHQMGFFSEKGLTLDKVITVATPHLGVLSSPKTWLGRTTNRLKGMLGNIYGGRSIEHMTLMDRDGTALDGTRLPLLLAMTLPGSIFDAALLRCNSVYLYANAHNDNTVPYCTAALARHNKYRGLKDVAFLEGYPFIAGVYKISDDTVTSGSSPTEVGAPCAKLATQKAPTVISSSPLVEPGEGEISCPWPELAGNVDHEVNKMPSKSSVEGGRQQQEVTTSSSEDGVIICANGVSRCEDENSSDLVSKMDCEGDKGSSGATDVPARGIETHSGDKCVGLQTVAVLMLLIPLLLLQFVLLIVPLRIAHAVFNGDDRVRQTEGDEPEAGPLPTTGAEAVLVPRLDPGSTCPEPGDNGTTAVEASATLPALSIVDGGDDNEDVSAQSTPLLRLKCAGDDCRESNAGTNADVGGKGEGCVRSREVFVRCGEGDAAGEGSMEKRSLVLNEVPLAIRKNMMRAELGLWRVDVCLPGVHTHGTIVFRRSFNRAGRFVLSHLATILFEAKANSGALVDGGLNGCVE